MSASRQPSLATRRITALLRLLTVPLITVGVHSVTRFSALAVGPARHRRRGPGRQHRLCGSRISVPVPAQSRRPAGDLDRAGLPDGDRLPAQREHLDRRRARLWQAGGYRDVEDRADPRDCARGSAAHTLARLVQPDAGGSPGQQFAREFALYINFSGIGLILWSGDAVLSRALVATLMAWAALAELTLYASE